MIIILARHPLEPTIIKHLPSQVPHGILSGPCACPSSHPLFSQAIIPHKHQASPNQLPPRHIAIASPETSLPINFPLLSRTMSLIPNPTNQCQAWDPFCHLPQLSIASSNAFPGSHHQPSPSHHQPTPAITSHLSQPSPSHQPPPRHGHGKGGSAALPLPSSRRLRRGAGAVPLAAGEPGTAAPQRPAPNALRLRGRRGHRGWGA